MEGGGGLFKLGKVWYYLGKTLTSSGSLAEQFTLRTKLRKLRREKGKKSERELKKVFSFFFFFYLYNHRMTNRSCYIVRFFYNNNIYKNIYMIDYSA
jgi:hypothetical protein